MYSGEDFPKSDLFITIIAGIFLSLMEFSRAISESVHLFGSVTMMAISALESILLLRSILFSPNSDVSSNPGVSKKTTGPIGSNSKGFSTTSVVVPGISDTIAMS